MNELFSDANGKPFNGTIGEFDEKGFGEKKEYKNGILCHYDIINNEYREEFSRTLEDIDGCTDVVEVRQKHVIGRMQGVDDNSSFIETEHKEGTYDSENKFTGKVTFSRESLNSNNVHTLVKGFDKDDIAYTDVIEENREYTHRITTYKDGNPFRVKDEIIRENGDCSIRINNILVHKWVQKDGKKHGVSQKYDNNGNVIELKYYQQGEDCTNKYNQRKKIAAKRIEEEKRTGKIFRKMSAFEKAVSIKNANKSEMTMFEKVLAQKAKKR